MITSNVRSRFKYSYGEVSSIGRVIANILDEIYIPDTFLRSIDVAEKTDCKFTKPVNQSEKTLYVYIGGWRLVTQERDKKIISGNSSMYETNVNASSDITLYSPSKTAVYLVKTPEGDVIAELIEGKLLNILFDIFKLDEDRRREILNKIILDLIINHFNFNLEELKKEHEDSGRRAVVEFLTELASREVNEAEREVERLNRRIKDYEETLLNFIRERKMAMAKAEGLRVQSLKGAEGINDELQKLTNISSIDSVSVDGREKEVVLHTKDIYINNAGKRYYIGKFNVRINPLNASVKFINLNNCRRSYWGSKCHHPHVDQQGYPCWGNVGTAVRNYIQQNEFQALASLLIGYLESVNTTDAAGRNITSWDVVNRAGQVVQKGYYYADPPANSETYLCTECQDVFTRNDISLSRGDVHVCRHCADKYFVCPDCGDICKVEDAEQCERCGGNVCEDCHDDNAICESCIEAERVAAQLAEPGAVLCQYCNRVINEDELHTCETCGEQGCGECITFDGRYSCPNHR